MTIYYEFDRQNEIQMFVAAEKTGKEIKIAILNADADFPHLILSNHLTDNLWSVRAFNFDKLLGDANSSSEVEDMETLCDRQDWATAQDIFAKALKKLEWDSHRLREPKFLGLIEQMQQVLDENPNLVKHYPEDFFHSITELSKKGNEPPSVFVWNLNEMGMHLFWQTDKLRGRYHIQENIKDFEYKHTSEVKIFIGHPKYNTLQEVSPSEALKFFPINKVELRAFLEYVPKLEDFLAEPDSIAEDLRKVRAIAKDLNIEESLERRLTRLADIAYNREGVIYMRKDGDLDFLWAVVNPETQESLINGGINFHSNSKEWSMNT